MTKEEAIKTIREARCTSPLRDALECLIPELAESKDERIRKELLAVINDLVLPDEQKARFNAWLEKQKEQKPVEWSEEDEKNLELVTACVYEFYPDPVMKYKLKDWLKSLRPSWKPSNEQMGALYDSIEWEGERAEDVDFILKSLYNDLKKLM